MALKNFEVVDQDGYELDFSLFMKHKEEFRVIAHSLDYVLLSNVEGDIAEFGSVPGDYALQYALCMKTNETRYAPLMDKLGAERRKIHLFDSFQGYPEVNNEIDQGSYLLTHGYFYADGDMADMSVEELARTTASRARQFLGEDRVVTHIGYFKDTLRALNPDVRFSLVHIDCDLYESTRDALDFLFANDVMSNGSVVLFGEAWNYNQASPDQGYRRAWRECAEAHGVKFSDSGEIAGWGHKFIIHR